MPHLTLINPEDVSDAEASTYKVREAARAIVFDADNKVALLHATKFNYYKLPGGGIEEGEKVEEALKRECLEEIGCEIEGIKELGIITEYRKKFNLKQTSYCFIAKVVGKKGTPHLMEDEIEEGFETVWMPIEEAFKKVSEGNREVYEAQYMIARDSAFLQEAITSR